MQDGRPSATAWRVALRRAAHQLIDRPLVLADAAAVRIVGEEAAREFVEKEAQAGGRREALSRALRAFVVARSRFAEDRVAEAVSRGVRQYAVLGAGLDTFAYRNIFEGQGLAVLEVDHPATQAWKRQLLERAGIAAASMRFVPVDFERQTLAEKLSAAGFREGEPASFSWLGVVPYLSLESFRETLRYLGRRPAGSEVAFDYAVSREGLSAAEQAGFDALARRVAAVGEPFRLFLAEEAMAAELNAAGFSVIEQWDAQRINAHYFAGRSDDLRVGGQLGRLVWARVN